MMTHAGAESSVRLQTFTQLIPGTDIRFAMQPIPGGKLTWNDPEKKGARVTVDIKPFYIEKLETRWEEYDVYYLGLDQSAPQVVGKDAISRPTKTYIPPDHGYGHFGYPVISVTSNAAMHYCEWLSLKTGKKYRLPTEAEWVYACGGGSNSLPSAQTLNSLAWHRGNSAGKTHPAGLKKPNAWGLYDMIGNAAEWCTGSAGTPAVRGGSFHDKPGNIGGFSRAIYSPSWQADDPQIPKSRWWLSDADFVGFRVVCEP
jgi:formylglycine-generating enzyme required for sulfatase activity